MNLLSKNRLKVACEGPEHDKQHRIEFIKSWRIKFHQLMLKLFQPLGIRKFVNTKERKKIMENT